MLDPEGVKSEIVFDQETGCKQILSSDAVLSDLDCFGMNEGDDGFEFLEEFDEETGCMSVTLPDGAKETNCPDGTGFFVDPGGMRIDRVFDESTGCVTETFPDGVSEVFCPEEELSLIN